MSRPAPIRTALHRPEPTLEGDTLALFRSLTEWNTPIPARLIETVAASEDESLRYLLSRRLGTISSHPAIVRAVSRLINREMQRADGEGVVWNTVLDALASGAAWSQLATADGSMGAIARDEEGLIPPEERARRLGPWLRTATKADISTALRFEAPALRAAVAQFAGSLTRPQVGQLAEYPELLENGALTPDARDEAARQLWSRYDRLAQIDYPDGRKQPPEIVINTLAREQAEVIRSQLIRLARENGLPAEVRDGILDTRPTARMRLRPVWEVIAADRNCPPDVLRRIATAPTERLTRPGIVQVWTRLLSNPSATDEIRDLTLSHPLCGVFIDCIFGRLAPEADLSLLSPPALLWLARAHQGSIPAVVRWVARHESANVEMDRELVRLAPEADVLAAVAARPASRWDPEIRAVLEKSRSSAVLSELLADATVEEYPALLERLWKSSQRAAAEALRRHSPRPARRSEPSSSPRCSRPRMPRCAWPRSAWSAPRSDLRRPLRIRARNRGLRAARDAEAFRAATVPEC
jgi:hypothetical protein